MEKKFSIAEQLKKVSQENLEMLEKQAQYEWVMARNRREKQENYESWREIVNELTRREEEGGYAK